MLRGVEHRRPGVLPYYGRREEESLRETKWCRKIDMVLLHDDGATHECMSAHPPSVLPLPEDILQ